jgi:hypothetical protein
MTWTKKVKHLFDWITVCYLEQGAICYVSVLFYLKAFRRCSTGRNHLTSEPTEQSDMVMYEIEVSRNPVSVPLC